MTGSGFWRALAACELVILVAVLVSLPTLGWASTWPPHSLALRCIAVGVIGGVVGFAELVSRYRDEPWLVASTAPGIAFTAMNAIAAIGALLLLEHFPQTLAAPADGVARVLEAGTGAMVVLRAKLLTVRQPGGADVAVGPAVAVDTFLTAINRDVDRRRAVQRHSLVTGRAASLRSFQFADAVAFLKSAILAFQAMDADDKKALNSSLDGLLTTTTSIPDEIKFASAGFDILNVFGQAAFINVFDALAIYLKGRNEPPRQGSP